MNTVVGPDISKGKSHVQDFLDKNERDPSYRKAPFS
ncbi:hypothetical protein SRABI80_02429 [Peribacillus frigoritolerans]|nr:hypothetical protein SRABI80_02429 [Peribacillus frigoritolerans]